MPTFTCHCRLSLWINGIVLLYKFSWLPRIRVQLNLDTVGIVVYKTNSEVAWFWYFLILPGTVFSIFLITSASKVRVRHEYSKNRRFRSIPLFPPSSCPFPFTTLSMYHTLCLPSYVPLKPFMFLFIRVLCSSALPRLPRWASTQPIGMLYSSLICMQQTLGYPFLICKTSYAIQTMVCGSSAGYTPACMECQRCILSVLRDAVHSSVVTNKWNMKMNYGRLWDASMVSWYRSSPVA